MNIPFLNLRAAHDPIREELHAALDSVIDSSAFAGGPFVKEFEEDFAAYCSAPHCAGVANGTDALWLALRALGVGPGDEVITVPNTFIATVEAITRLGARPVFVDIDEATHLMDLEKVRQAIGGRTRAIVPVHLYGQMVQMEPLVELAWPRGIAIVEDACQAHGASQLGRTAGTVGNAGAFSFYPGKNLGALGEGGAVVTKDEFLDRRIRVFREHGQSTKYYHAREGWNCRLDGLQAAFLSIKLRHLENGNDLRRRHAAAYRDWIGIDARILPVETAPGNTPVYHLFVVRVKNRDEVMRKMAEAGISCGIHYPKPLHLQEAYQNMVEYHAGSFPVAEKVSSEILSLPMFPELTDAQIETVVRSLKASLE